MPWDILGSLNPNRRLSVIEKLPFYLKGRWVRRVRDIKKDHDRMSNIDDEASFINDAAEKALCGVQ